MNNSFLDLAVIGGGRILAAFDGFESYSTGPMPDGVLSGGRHFAGFWAARGLASGTQDYDGLEDYAIGSSPHGQALGVGFGGAFVARINWAGVKDIDSFEASPTGVSAHGLSGGTGWGGSWVARP